MRKLIITLAALTMTLAASAQTAMPFIQEELNPAAAGLASTASASTNMGMAYSIFGNPAAQPFADQKMDVAVSYRNVSAGTSSINNITAAAAVKFGKLGISAGFHTEMFPSVAGASEGGGSMSKLNTSATMFGLGLSLGIGDSFGVGANIRYAMQPLDKSTTLSAINFDVMALYTIAGINVTAGVVGLGPAVKSVSNTTYALPASVRAGADYAMSFGALGVEAMASFDYYFSGNVGVGAGAQVDYNKMVFARLGFRYGSVKENFNAAPVPTNLAFGLGGKLFGVRLDVSYQLVMASKTGILSAGLAYSF